MARLLDSNQTVLLRKEDLHIGPFVFLRAFKVLNRSPWLARELTHNSQPLYALPGGGYATEARIRAVLEA